MLKPCVWHILTAHEFNSQSEPFCQHFKEMQHKYLTKLSGQTVLSERYLFRIPTHFLHAWPTSKDSKLRSRSRQSGIFTPFLHLSTSFSNSGQKVTRSQGRTTHLLKAHTHPCEVWWIPPFKIHATSDRDDYTLTSIDVSLCSASHAPKCRVTFRPILSSSDLFTIDDRSIRCNRYYFSR